MKKLILGLLFAVGFSYLQAQKMAPANVPLEAPRHLMNNFPRPHDLEWEWEGELLKAEFETGLCRRDHELWYDRAGNLVRQKSEIRR